LLFGKYIKHCRDKYHLTQEELVNKCYNFDLEFIGLDIGTLSRWERGITSPNVDKQIKIVKLLQSYENCVFPYFNSYDISELEHEFSKTGVQNLIGNSKNHILNFPHSNIIEENIKIINVYDSQNAEALLKMPNDILFSLTNNHYQLNLDILREWATNKGNLFLVSQYENNFFGMLLVLRIKPEVFEEVLSFERELKTLKDEDFSKDSQVGCSLPIAFFAYNNTIASFLYLRYYANLIANQNYILEVGSTTVIDGTVKLVEKIHLKKYKSSSKKSEELTSYKANLEDVLLRDDVFKMIFKK